MNSDDIVLRENEDIREAQTEKDVSDAAIMILVAVVYVVIAWNFGAGNIRAAGNTLVRFLRTRKHLLGIIAKILIAVITLILASEA